MGRLILSTFHYSERKKKLYPEAFMPSPSEGNEISILRFDYSHIDFCKCRGLNIAHRRNNPNHPCKFVGVAFLKSEEVIQAPLTEVFWCEPISSPLDENDNLRPFPVSTQDQGTPSHGDIKYNFNVIAHKPVKQAFKKKVLKPLLQKINGRFFKDIDISTEVWVGEEITL